MQRLRETARSDHGETLVELIVSVAILGIAGVAILSGLLLSVKASTQHRNEASGGAYVRSFAEAIQNYVDNSGAYSVCGPGGATAMANYTSVAVPSLPGGYTKSVSSVQSWNGTTWGSCTADGIQRLELTVQTTGDATRRADETLTVILRQPCNGPVPTSASNPC
ncbi:type II secretion system protein [Nocardioides albidus]|uniref:Type II secretion system protein n=1 Tax=Nocardioides albidus TaxID=1517589 RepID=A0A5C4WPR9_9ACTN|nr:type II secretion system protein [Nocardioides albidus]TNM50220.1 type II secretion system protein [Nocardioides albidus]